MFNNLDELIGYLTHTVPEWKKATQLKRDEQGRYVTFRWNGRDFLVQKSLEVFELKNSSLFVTGASALMQSALATKNKNQRVLESSIDALRQAESLLDSGQTEPGLKLIGTIKHTISKLTRRSNASPMLQRR